jgi:hypothetical protein
MTLREQVFPGIVSYAVPENLCERLRCLAELYPPRPEEVDHRQPRLESLGSIYDPQQGYVEALRTHLWKLSREYSAYTSQQVASGEDMLLMSFGVGAYSKPHIDNRWDRYRTCSSITFLNVGDYSGGDLVFPELDLRVTPTAPATVYFPAGIPFKHRTTRVTSGVRVSLRCFWSDLPASERPNRET